MSFDNDKNELTCVICFDSVNKDELNSDGHMDLPKCKCKIVIHQKCYNDCKKACKILCPICRINDDSIRRNDHDFNDILLEILNHQPTPIFIRFIITFIASFIMTIFYVFPLFIWEFAKPYLIKIDLYCAFIWDKLIESDTLFCLILAYVIAMVYMLVIFYVNVIFMVASIIFLLARIILSLMWYIIVKFYNIYAEIKNNINDLDLEPMQL
jgi:hypothetical protein